MYEKSSSNLALVLLRHLVARGVLRNFIGRLVSQAGELISGGYAVASDVERGIQLRAQRTAPRSKK